jgi:hypothetical protein
MTSNFLWISDRVVDGSNGGNLTENHNPLRNLTTNTTHIAFPNLLVGRILVNPPS